MKYDILDGPEKNFEALKPKLRKAGLNDVYEKKGWMLVRKTEAVQVKVKHNGVKYEVKPLFPQIGNSVQIVVTIVLWLLLGYFDVPLSIVLAILLGQVASYAYHFPKIDKLRKEVETAITSRN